MSMELRKKGADNGLGVKIRLIDGSRSLLCVWIMFGEHRLQSHLELRTVHFRDNFVTRKKLRDIFVIRCNIK